MNEEVLFLNRVLEENLNWNSLDFFSFCLFYLHFFKERGNNFNSNFVISSSHLNDPIFLQVDFQGDALKEQKRKHCFSPFLLQRKKSCLR